MFTMAAYHRVHDDILICTPCSSVLFSFSGSCRGPISVAGLITNAGMTLAVDKDIQRQLLNRPWESSDMLPTGASPTRRICISPGLLAELDPTRPDLVDWWPRSATTYGGPTTGHHRHREELIIPDDDDGPASPPAQPPHSTPEHGHVWKVSSHWA